MREERRKRIKMSNSLLFALSPDVTSTNFKFSPTHIQERFILCEERNIFIKYSQLFRSPHIQERFYFVWGEKHYHKVLLTLSLLHTSKKKFKIITNGNNLIQNEVFHFFLPYLRIKFSCVATGTITSDL